MKKTFILLLLAVNFVYGQNATSLRNYPITKLTPLNRSLLSFDSVDDSLKWISPYSFFSETVLGLDYSSLTGVLSLSYGHFIPTTIQRTKWNEAYAWGNHTAPGYLTTLSGQSVGGLADIDTSGKADGKILKYDANLGLWKVGEGTGTVTSVGLSMPSIFSISGSPITTSGTFSVDFSDTTAGRVLATPAGADGALGLRLISNAHIDASAAISASKLQSTVMVEGENISLLNNDAGYLTSETGDMPRSEFPDSLNAHNELVRSSDDIDKLNNVLSMTEANGDLFYYNDGWTNLAKGSPGKVLKMQGNNLPAWDTDAAGGGGSATADSAATAYGNKDFDDLLDSDLKIDTTETAINRTKWQTFIQNNQTPGGGGTWGSITGTLSNQTDLNNALGARPGSEAGVI